MAEASSSLLRATVAGRRFMTLEVAVSVGVLLLAEAIGSTAAHTASVSIVTI